MPISPEARTVGTRVSYTDVANPRRVGTVIAVHRSAGGVQYSVQWDTATYAEPLDYSDLAQHGWNVEPPAAPAPPVAALRLNVYRPADGAECNLNGISSRYDELALVGTVDQRHPRPLSSTTAKPLPAKLSLPDYVERAEGERFAAAPVVLLVRNMGTTVSFSLVPAVRGDDGRFRMMELNGPAGAVMRGGNLAATSDSRLGELVASFLPEQTGPTFVTALPVHDRVEPWR